MVVKFSAGVFLRPNRVPLARPHVQLRIGTAGHALHMSNWRCLLKCLRFVNIQGERTTFSFFQWSPYLMISLPNWNINKKPKYMKVLEKLFFAHTRIGRTQKLFIKTIRTKHKRHIYRVFQLKWNSLGQLTPCCGPCNPDHPTGWVFWTLR